MNQKLSVLFVIKLNKKNQKGVCPLNIRITYNKRRKEFSSRVYVNPVHWNAKKQSISTKNNNTEYLNAQLSLIHQKINNAYLSLQLKDYNFTLDDIYNQYLGKKIKKEADLVSYFHQYLEYLSKLIGKEIKEVTHKKYQYTCSDVERFIKYKYDKKDIPLNSLKLEFLDGFEYYLKTVKEQKQVTINKAIQRLKRPVKKALSEGYLDKDPFLLHKSKKVKKEIIFLTQNELNLLEQYKFSQKRLQFIKDLFIFSCHTGLAYGEISSLKVHHITVGFDERLWINMKREKTQKDMAIPLLRCAIQLLEKYKNPVSDFIFPTISNQKYNSYLKEIAIIVGIEKRLTTHTARRTFASTMLLRNNVPMHIVSELLGHSSVTTTQESYGKVVQESISSEIIKLSKK